MDALSNVLQVVRLSGSVFFTAEFSAPWALDSPNQDLLASLVMPGAEHVVIFHILTQGECLIECDGHSSIRLAPGDAIVLPLLRTADRRLAAVGRRAVQFRICFRWTAGGPEDVEITDYH